MTDASGTARDQLKAIVQRVERIEAEIKDLNDDKSEIYKEARANGFDVKTIKKVITKRKIDVLEREEQDAMFDTYWNAIHGSELVHAHARENIEEFDPITGEFTTKSPRNAAEAVPERTAHQSLANGPCDAEAERPALVDADEAEAEAMIEGQPSVTVALTVQHDGVNVGGPERAGVTAGETAIQFHAKASDDACEVGRKALGRAEASADAPDGAELVSRGVGDRAPTATSEAMDVTGGESAASNSEKDTAVHGNAGRHSPDRVSPQAETATTGSDGANAGGDDVDGSAVRADTSNTAGGIVSNPPAKPLRPHCLRPDNCGGYGSNHCFSCRKAAKANDEEEAA